MTVGIEFTWHCKNCGPTTAMSSMVGRICSQCGSRSLDAMHGTTKEDIMTGKEDKTEDCFSLNWRTMPKKTPYGERVWGNGYQNVEKAAEKGKMSEDVWELMGRLTAAERMVLDCLVGNAVNQGYSTGYNDASNSREADRSVRLDTEGLEPEDHETAILIIDNLREAALKLVAHLERIHSITGSSGGVVSNTIQIHAYEAIREWKMAVEASEERRPTVRPERDVEADMAEIRELVGDVRNWHKDAFETIDHRLRDLEAVKFDQAEAERELGLEPNDGTIAEGMRRAQMIDFMMARITTKKGMATVLSRAVCRIQDIERRYKQNGASLPFKEALNKFVNEVNEKFDALSGRLDAQLLSFSLDSKLLRERLDNVDKTIRGLATIDALKEVHERLDMFRDSFSEDLKRAGDRIVRTEDRLDSQRESAGNAIGTLKAKVEVLEGRNRLL